MTVLLLGLNLDSISERRLENVPHPEKHPGEITVLKSSLEL